MKERDSFSTKQYGFIEGRKKSLQLIKVIDDWTEILDKGVILGVVYMDFQKAFDTVPYRKLLSKLEHYGIKGKVLGSIKDFLLFRTQSVNVGPVSL